MRTIDNMLPPKWIHQPERIKIANIIFFLNEGVKVYGYEMVKVYGYEWMKVYG